MNNREITFPDFVKELEREVRYFESGGTNYRLRTSQLALSAALSLAKNEEKAILFLNRKKHKKLFLNS